MSTGGDTSDERGPLERAYDEQLSEKIGEILKLAADAGVPIFVHAGLDDGARCTSLVGVPDLSSAPIFRSLFLVAKHDFTAVGPLAGTGVESWLYRMGTEARAAYYKRCAKIEGGLA